MPLQATSGAASYDAFGGGVPVVPKYIEDYFSTWLYSGTGAGSSNLPQTITNGIDLSTKGGLVWIKARNTSGDSNYLFDTARTAGYRVQSNQTDAQAYNSDTLTSFNTTGFTLGTDATIGGVNYASSRNYVSWSFAEAPKFFDVVTYTGNSTNRTIAHSLGSVPGTIIVKRTNTTGDWVVYHRSLGATKYVILNSTGASGTYSGYWNDTEPTDSVFSLSGTSGDVNGTGNTYVAYLFAHNAGGFGLTGTDNVISCGSYTGNGSTNGPVVTLGYEAQWVMIKSASASGNWSMFDNMRGVATASAAGNGLDARLLANDSAAEDSGADFISFTSTGFQIANSFGAVNTNGDTYIYVAIRRGPMKVPTDGTKVFAPVAVTSSTGTQNTTNFPLDMQMAGIRGGWGENITVPSRLTGVSSNTTSSGNYLITSSTSAEATGGNITRLWDNIGFQTAQQWSGSGMAYWNFRRAPGFFDEVCFTGPTSGSTTQTHNLTAVPELMIVRPRSIGSYWYVYSASLGISKYLALNLNDAVATSSNFWVTAPTSTAFTCSVDNMGSSGANRPHVAYLFASAPGVSKVGTYTGTGATQTINCGFTGGARFVLVKRTDSTGDWYVWDTARGMVSGTDPSLLLNSTAAEVNANSIYTTTGGFEIVSTAAGINASGGSYIYLSIA